MRRVVAEYRSGERLPPATAPTLRWLQVTEEVFFTSPVPFSVRSLASSLRPDPAAIRRNAYYRLLGMDLNHGTEDGRPYQYVKADVSNRDFSVAFESLLAEVWKGYINRNNFITANATDDNAIDELVRRLQEMLNARRQFGNLAREEFDAVATLSWFFLTIAYDTQIVNDLDATAFGVADRLRLIGERVGLAPHARADSYFQLAPPMSNDLARHRAERDPRSRRRLEPVPRHLSARHAPDHHPLVPRDWAEPQGCDGRAERRGRAASDRAGRGTRRASHEWRRQLTDRGGAAVIGGPGSWGHSATSMNCPSRTT